MSYFLDTNTCIQLLKNSYPALTERFSSQRPSSIKVPAMVQAELLAGAREGADYAGIIRKIELFLSPLEIVGFDEKAAVSFGEMRARLNRASVKIGPYDLIIAATVMSRDGILVTSNTKEFSRVEGLIIENWTK